MFVEQDSASAWAPVITARQAHADRCGSVRTKTSRSPAEQIWRCCREDVARLMQVLRELRYGALLRSLDGAVLLPLIPVSRSASVPSAMIEGVIAAPIYDPSGEQLASFEVTTEDDHASEASRRVLRMLIDSAARAIGERLFRIQYRRQWILAARRDDRPETYLLLALNSNLRVLGADRYARQMLNAHGCDPELEVGVSTLFRIDPTHLRGKKYGDETLRIVQPEGNASWSAVLTPPDANPLASHKGESVVGHTRPRLDVILGAEPVPPEPQETLGLPPRMLRHIVEYIDMHLDSELTTEGLAAILKVSASHFARSFTASVGSTPHAYVMGRRLSRAQELLAQTQLPLVEIALSTGFADQSHFCRRFHQMVGVPPRTFRKQVLHGQLQR